MKRLFIILIILFLSVWLGATIATDPGYVLVVYRKWTVEAPLWFAVILLLVIFGLLYALVRSWRNLRDIPKRLQLWRLRRQTLNAQHLTQQGLLLLAAGNPAAAEKKLLRGISHSHMSWLNYLVAAYAANAQNNLNAQNDYLHKASEVEPKASVLIGLAQTQFYIQQQQWNQALSALKNLYLHAPKQKYVLQLLMQTYLQLQDWEGLLSILPNLRKQSVFSTDKISALEVQAYQALLTKDQQNWQRVPRTLRENPILVGAYVEALMVQQLDDEAERILNKTLSKNWDDHLVQLYGLVKSKKIDRQLSTAETWLKKYPNDAVLLLTAGRLCIHNQLWGKARSYFDASLARRSGPEIYQELAKLLDQLGEHVLAKNYYIKGLELALKSKE